MTTMAPRFSPSSLLPRACWRRKHSSYLSSSRVVAKKMYLGYFSHPLSTCPATRPATFCISIASPGSTWGGLAIGFSTMKVGPL